MANIIGNNPEFWAKNQVDLRQQLLGAAERTPEILAWQTTKTAWIRAASSVYIEEGVKIEEKDANGEVVERFINKSTDLTGASYYRGRELAREYVLFNGTVGLYPYTTGDELFEPEFQETNFIELPKSGITENQSNINNSAYGFGGIERGLQPMPGIIDLNINTYNRGSLRKAELKLKAYNRNQFQILDALYMRPGYTILIEWGHTQYFTGKPEEYEYTKANFNTSPFLSLMAPDDPDSNSISQDNILAQIRNEIADTVIS